MDVMSYFLAITNSGLKHYIQYQQYSLSNLFIAIAQYSSLNVNNVAWLELFFVFVPNPPTPFLSNLTSCPQMTLTVPPPKRDFIFSCLSAYSSLRVSDLRAGSHTQRKSV